MSLITSCAVVCLALVQLFEAIHPGIISGPVNLGLLWLLALVSLLAVGRSAVTSAKRRDRLDQKSKPPVDRA